MKCKFLLALFIMLTIKIYSQNRDIGFAISDRVTINTLPFGGTGYAISDRVTINTYTGIPIEVSYSVSENEPVSQIIYFPYSDNIDDLHFYEGITSFLSMPSNTIFCSSSNFRIKNVGIANNNQFIDFIDDYLPDIVLSDNNFINLEYNIKIMVEDDNLTNNQISGTSEIWTSDFDYGIDNYSFGNQGATSPEIVSEIINDVTRLTTTQFSILPSSFFSHLNDMTTNNGLCYGFAFTSIHYKYEPALIPIPGQITYDLTETDILVDYNIVEGFKAQVPTILEILYNSKNYSKAYLSELYLNEIKEKLEDNQLLVASYDNHATVLHSLIKNDNNYNLFEYNNNYPPYGDEVNEFTPYKNENIFIDNGESVIFDINNKNFNFRIPRPWLTDLDFTDLSSILDSLFIWEIDSLAASGKNVIVYSDNSNDYNPVAEVQLDCDFEVIDHGIYRIFYIDNLMRPEIEILSNKEGSYTIMAVNTNNQTCRDTAIQILFSSLPSSSENCRAIFIDIFAEEPYCEIDEDEDDIADLIISPNYYDEIVNPDNLPPNLFQELPIINFSEDINEFSITLKDYFSDEIQDNLTFEILSVPDFVTAEIEDSILNIYLQNSFTNLSYITLEVSDGNYPISYNIYLNYETSVEINNSTIPNISKLYNPYPNPFNPKTTIAYSLGKQGFVELKVYNLRGQHVKTLVAEDLFPGNYSVHWYGFDKMDKKVGSGIYFYQYSIDRKIIDTRKCILMK